MSRWLHIWVWNMGEEPRLGTEAGGLLIGSPVVESSRTGVSTMKTVIEKGGARVSALTGTEVLHLALPAFTESTVLSVPGLFYSRFHTRGAPGEWRGREGQCNGLICFQWEQIMS